MRWIISIALLLLLSACADLGYYWHNASGHLSVMNQRVDIEEMLADDQLNADLRNRLLLLQEIRHFSIERLDLPSNDSYSSYVELDQPYVVQNIFAAPEFSTRLYEWCYPVIGCASYRGYYDEARMLAYSEDLKSRGLEVYIGRVSAYSTLGWFDDPVLSSFINWPDPRVAGLLFHELTHQQIYIDNDTVFNESLASAVQQIGTELWLKSRQQNRQLEQLIKWSRYRDDVIGLIGGAREQLTKIYAGVSSDAVKRKAKALVFSEARNAHAEIATKHGIKGGYTKWFAGELNNAKIGSVAAYNSLTPAFINMIRAYHLDFSLFFAYAQRVGDMERAARDSCLQAWSQRMNPDSTDCPGNNARPTFSGRLSSARS